MIGVSAPGARFRFLDCVPARGVTVLVRRHRYARFVRTLSLTHVELSSIDGSRVFRIHALTMWEHVAGAAFLPPCDE